jgi:hypothetical protein
VTSAWPETSVGDQLDACERDPTRVDELAAALGPHVLADPELRFRWQVVELRALLLHADTDHDDRIRERYGELLDEYRAAPARLAALRPIGDEIRRLERAGVLPSSLVVRTPRPPHSRG